MSSLNKKTARSDSLCGTPWRSPRSLLPPREHDRGKICQGCFTHSRIIHCFSPFVKHFFVIPPLTSCVFLVFSPYKYPVGELIRSPLLSFSYYSFRRPIVLFSLFSLYSPSLDSPSSCLLRNLLLAFSSPLSSFSLLFSYYPSVSPSY